VQPQSVPAITLGAGVRAGVQVFVFVGTNTHPMLHLNVTSRSRLAASIPPEADMMAG
jgi:hypothetical protein